MKFRQWSPVFLNLLISVLFVLFSPALPAGFAAENNQGGGMPMDHQMHQMGPPMEQMANHQEDNNRQDTNSSFGAGEERSAGHGGHGGSGKNTAGAGEGPNWPVISGFLATNLITIAAAALMKNGG
ncbi:MAG: hypothetical protein C4589_10550 [Peptococcaceae bacterium]|nr:MAG: hypothetical protein C4589_10550 [Peptococcaceae bacterium]